MSVFACALPDESLIHLRGAGIPEFLQGQLTCDTRKLSRDHAVSGALCNVKGRVITDLLVLQISDDHSVLRVRRSIAKHVASILTRYAQFSRIEVAASEVNGCVAGIYTVQAFEAGMPDEFQRSAEVHSVATIDDALLLRRSSTQLEVVMLSDGDQKPQPFDRTGIDPGVHSDWDYETLRHGHLALDYLDSEKYTPQALNYDLTGRVAFDKGCYTGQEVVARLHYKGKSKRRLQIYLLEDSEATPAIGTKLCLSDGSKLGSVIRIAEHSSGARLIAAEILDDHRQAKAYIGHTPSLEPLSS